MKGSIKQRAKGSWSIIIYLGKNTITNKKQYKWYTFKGTKKEAEKYLIEKINEVNNGIFINSKEMNMEDYLNYWYNECCLNKLSPTTYESYKRNLDNHIIPIFKNIKLKDLQPLHLQNFYSHKLECGLSKTTVLYLHRILHRALNQATKWQLISKNIADNVEPPKKDKYIATVLNTNQLSLLIEKVKLNKELYIPVMIAISTGMRRGEVLGLTWNNICLDKSYLYVVQALYPIQNKLIFSKPKTQTSIRKINLPNTLVEILKAHKENQNFYNPYNLVCCLENGEPINPSTLSHKFKDFLQLNNLPNIRFHDLRHSHASLLLLQGVHAKYISERLGHSNIAITMDLYSHAYEETNKDIADKFDTFLKT